jgi:excisionase family DNA binding protein
MENLLSVVEAATRLGISKWTLISWMGKGRVPYVRLGRRVLFDPQDLAAWVEGNKVGVKG